MQKAADKWDREMALHVLYKSRSYHIPNIEILKETHPKNSKEPLRIRSLLSERNGSSCLRTENAEQTGDESPRTFSYILDNPDHQELFRKY